jgi:hypothetical protein
VAGDQARAHRQVVRAASCLGGRLLRGAHGRGGRDHRPERNRYRSLELLKRGILVNPNEKFYISTVHTDADVDRTLDACDQAFAAIRG